jgi:hypothetical protein
MAWQRTIFNLKYGVAEKEDPPGRKEQSTAGLSSSDSPPWFVLDCTIIII